MTNNNLVKLEKSYTYAASLVQYVTTCDKRSKLAEKVQKLAQFYTEDSPEIIAAKAALSAFDRNEKTVAIMERKDQYESLSDEEKEIINLGAGKLPARLTNDSTFMSDMDKVHNAATAGTLKGDHIRDLVAVVGKLYGGKVRPYKEEGTIAEAYNAMRYTGFKVTGKSEPIKLQKRNTRNWERTTAIYLYACLVSR